MMLKFSNPKLHDCGGDPTLRWYIDYRIWYDNGTSKRYQKWIPMCKGVKQRRKLIARQMLKDIAKQLRLGALAEKQDAELNLFTKSETLFIHAAKDSLVIAEVHNKLRYDSVRSLKSSLNNFVSWLKKKRLNNVQCRDMSRVIATEYINDMIRAKKKSDVTINNNINDMATILNYMISDCYLEQNAFSRVKKIKRVRKLNDRGLSPEIRDQTIALLKRDHNQLYLICMIQYYTFARPKEICRLKVYQVNLKERFIAFDRNQTKNHRRKNPLITDGLYDVFQELEISTWNKNHYLFTRDGNPGNNYNERSADYISRKYRQIVKKAGIGENNYLYSWKYTGIQDHYKAKIPKDELIKQSGQSEIAILDIYLENEGEKPGQVFVNKAPNLTDRQ